jgi:hypothetical protein
MRYVSCILLAVLTITVLGPVSFCLFSPCEGGDEVLGELDVCHRSAPALSTGGEMPCVQTCPCQSPPPLSVRIGAHIAPLLSEFIIVSLNEQPPETLL